MTRRRLILAIVAAVLCGVAWWLSLDRLSAEERLLVGRWTCDCNSGTGYSLLRFQPDRRFYGLLQYFGPGVMVERSGQWFIRGGELVFDGETSAVSRTFRPIVRSIGRPVNSILTYRLESITARELILVMSDGTRET